MKLGDIVRLRKAHPCGGYEWEVMRVGAHVGLRCLKCRHKVLLEKGVFQRRLETITSGGQEPGTRFPPLSPPL